MNLLKKLFNDNKDEWFSRQINGYKGPVYYRFVEICSHSTEIELIRYYPVTNKWQKDYITKVEYLNHLCFVEDEEILANLNKEYAILLLTRKR